MLNSNHLIGFGVAGAQLSAANITQIASATYSGVHTASPSTFSSMGIGAEHDARKVVLAIYAGDDANSVGAVNSVTVGGSSATRVVENAAISGVNVSIWSIDYPTGGTTADVVVNSSGTANYYMVATYRLLSYDSSPDFTGEQTNGTGTSPILDIVLTIPDNCSVLVLAGASTDNVDSAAPFTWTTEATSPDVALGNSSGEDAECVGLNYTTGKSFDQNVQFNGPTAAEQHCAIVGAVWVAE